MRNNLPRLRDLMDGETICMIALGLTILISVVYCLMEDYAVKQQERRAPKLLCPLCGSEAAK